MPPCSSDVDGGVAAWALASTIMDDLGLLHKAASNFLDVVELGAA